MIPNGTTLRTIPVSTEYDKETLAGYSRNNRGEPHPRKGGKATPTATKRSSANRRKGIFPEKKAVYRETHSVLYKVISEITGTHKTDKLKDMLSTHSKVSPLLGQAKYTIVANVCTVLAM